MTQVRDMEDLSKDVAVLVEHKESFVRILIYLCACSCVGVLTAISNIWSLWEYGFNWMFPATFAVWSWNIVWSARLIHKHRKSLKASQALLKEARWFSVNRSPLSGSSVEHHVDQIKAALNNL